MKKTLLGRSLAVLLAMALLLAGCAASKPGNSTDAGTTAALADTTAAQDDTTASAGDTTAPDGENQITFFSMNLNQTIEENHYLMAYPNMDGTVYVEYVGDVKKVGTNMDAAVLSNIMAAVEQTKLSEINGQNVYEDGEAVGSVYVEYSNGTALGASFTGAIPQVYVDAYEAMEACFRDLTADLAVYVPAPVVSGEVDADALAELMQILENSGIENLDMFQICDVVMDDSFPYVMGLSTADGIVRGTNCSAMMITTPYSLVIATLEVGVNVETVRADFLNNLDWTKWVCVMPTDAMVAQKGNMVLCLMGADALYRQTADAVAVCGWENVEELPFPGA